MVVLHVLFVDVLLVHVTDHVGGDVGEGGVGGSRCAGTIREPLRERSGSSSVVGIASHGESKLADDSST